MKNIKSLSILTLVFFIGVNSCKKEDNGPSIEEELLAEALPAQEIEILDNIPEATSFSKNTVVLPDGEILSAYLEKIDKPFYDRYLRPQAINVDPIFTKKHLLARILAVALNLTERSFHQKPDEGANKPSQNGLAYSWGSKKFNVRQSPPGEGTSCQQLIYGLDCSGFIHQLFSTAGVNLLSGPANKQRKAEVLQKAISSSISQLDKITVCDLGSIPKEQFQSGDIIYWTNSSDIATHIGIVLKDIGGTLAVFQSNGAQGDNSLECLNNIGVKRGPRRLLLNDPYWFGPKKKYGITRIGEASDNPEIMLTGGSEKYWYQNAGGLGDGGNYVSFKSDGTGLEGWYKHGGLIEKAVMSFEWKYVNGDLRVLKMRYINGWNSNYIFTIDCTYPKILISPCEIFISASKAYGNISTPPGSSNWTCNNAFLGNAYKTYLDPNN